MQREIASVRVTAGVAAAALAAATVALAGCGSSAGGPAASQTPSARSALAKSHMKVLTKLKRRQLCAVLTRAEATKILGAKTAAPVYADRHAAGVTCQWVKRGAGKSSNDRLYLGISAVADWTATQAVDKALRTHSLKIHGHPAVAAGRQAKHRWAQVDVALGGAGDPVAEYRAPTMHGAVALAKAATPRLIAMG